MYGDGSCIITSSGFFTDELCNHRSNENAGETDSYCSYKDIIDIDLKVDDVKVSRVNPPRAGSLAKFMFVLTNNGEDTANNVAYRIETGSSDPDPMYNIPSIEPKTSIDVWSFIVYSESGTYYPNIIIDPDNKIDETDENNNENKFTMEVI